MRIGFDISKLSPPRDGLGTYARALLPALAEEAAADDTFVLYDPVQPVADATWEAFVAGVPAHRRAAFTRGGRTGPHGTDVDVFHATCWQCPPAAFRGRLVFSCFDLTILSHPQAHTVDNRIHCLHGLLTAAERDATFLTLSQDTATALGTWLEVPEARIRVVPGAVDRVTMPEQATVASVLDAHDLSPGYVLAVGTLEPRKNLPRLVDAWAGLPDSLRDRHPLVLVGGRGWKLDALDARLGTPGTGDAVRRLGVVEDADLPALYRAAGAFAYPSLAEGFGFPVLEAMTCGTPVLTSHTSCLPEVAGEAALLVDPMDVDAIRDGLRRLLTDEALAHTLRTAGPPRAASFSWRQAARTTLALYRR